MAALLAILALGGAVSARSAGTPNTYEIVGNSGVSWAIQSLLAISSGSDNPSSAQQMFLGSLSKVYVVDKTERNGNNLTIDRPIFHPAWSAEYDLATDTVQAMDIVTNSFCAGGVPLGNGTWLNVGGNNAVGLAGNSVQPGDGPYLDLDGGQIVRVMDPCPFNDSCAADWTEWSGMSSNRWYPTLVTMADGSGMVIGGELWGGYVNVSSSQTLVWENLDPVRRTSIKIRTIRRLFLNTTLKASSYSLHSIEYVPPRNGVEPFPFLQSTQPLNLFPIAWLLPSGKLFLQAGNSTALYDFDTNTTTWIADMPGGQRVYPASAGTALLPLTPANNYTMTALFCGGLNQNANSDYNPLTNDITQFQGIKDCHMITPDVTPNQYDATDDLIDGTVMLNLINLPDGRIFGTGGCGQGTAGYGWQDFGNGQGYGKNPRLTPAGYYNHSAPAGGRWSRDAIQSSTVPRMYHSAATLLPDGSIMIAGSNPNADFVGVTVDGISVNASDPFHTEYRVERFYPDYWAKPRPKPSSFPDTISYGGQYFTVTLPKENVTSVASLDTLKAVLIRTGFATHAMNFGQMHVELQTSYTVNKDGTATVNIGQLPPNPSLMAPGPALLFLVMNDVPSMAEFVMVGSGRIEQQVTQDLLAVPPSDISAGISTVTTKSSGASTSAATNASGSHASASDLSWGARTGIALAALGVGALALGCFLFFFCRRRKARRILQNKVYSKSGYTDSTASMEKVKASMLNMNDSNDYLDVMPYSDLPSSHNSPSSTAGLSYSSQRMLPQGATNGRI